MQDIIRLKIDGRDRSFRVTPSMSLVQLLKREGYHGLRQACDGGNCGGCTVLMDKRPVLSCLMHAHQAAGKEILTIDGVLQYDEKLPLLPRCLKRAGSSQCGFCTCGFVMAIAGLYFKNPDPSEATIVRDLSGNLCRCTGYEKIIRGARLFFDVINDREKLEPLEETHEPFGKGVEKIDGDGLTTGRAAYVSDMTVPGLLHMKFLCADTVHAIIKNIDTAEAERLPGVRLVLTHKNTPDVPLTTAAQEYPEPSPYDQRLLDSRVRFHGEPVAAVVADDEATAEEAVRKIKTEYEELPVMLDFDSALHNTRAPIHPGKAIERVEDQSRNLVSSFHFTEGEMQWPDEMIVVEKTFLTSKHQHVHLEPHTAIACPDEQGRLIIYSSTQVPFDVRRLVSRVLGSPFSAVRVIKPRIGGGFGGKQEIIVEGLTAYAAKILGRPVKSLMTRKEEFTFARTRHPFEVHLKLGFTEDGEIRNLQTDILTDTGAYGGHGSTVAELAAMRISQIYRVPNVDVRIRVVYTNKSPSGAFRGYGEPQVFFALESLVDEAARKLKMDPAALRTKNHIRAGDRLNVATLFVNPPLRGQVVRTCLLDRLIERGKKLIEWQQRRTATDEYFTGKGMGISFQASGIANITRASATAALHRDGSVEIRTGAADIGTGSDTVLSQIAGQTLGLPVKDIHIITADTGTTPYDSGAYASNTTYFGGYAIKEACEKLKEAVLSYTAEKYELSPEELELRGDCVISRGRSIPLCEVAGRMTADTGSIQTIFHSEVKRDTAAPSFVATFVDLNVDKKTGKVAVVKVVQVLDCGMIVNPVLAAGQVEGTTVQAIGYALYEELNYTPNGRIKENDLFVYKIPTIFEKPEIRVEFLQEADPTGPFGIKSVGEVSYAPLAPAINNALYDACGIHMTTLPMTPGKVLKELQKIAPSR
jgi:putative selenate reductase molybdopterin-binding subunit